MIILANNTAIATVRIDLKILLNPKSKKLKNLNKIMIEV